MTNPTNPFDILIRNASLRGSSESLVDIGIANGVVISLEENLAGDAEQLIDAQGNLVTESFVNPHLHLCKVYTLQMMDEEALTSYHAEGMGRSLDHQKCPQGSRAGSDLWQYTYSRAGRRGWQSKA
jgi:cytosine/adenosine deaminase-related metal-dependent hydrolase